MQRKLVEDLHQYFSKMHHPTDQEKELLARVEAELPYVQISGIHWDDLAPAGFDASSISVEDIAGRLSDDFRDQLGYIAIPRKIGCRKAPKAGTPPCPKCGSSTAKFDTAVLRNRCTACRQEWGDSYVLVQHPDDPTHFGRAGIGYPSFEAQDSGARYVPEYDFILRFGRDPDPKRCFRPLTLDAYQKCTGRASIDALCELIQDEKGLRNFDAFTMWVPTRLLTGE